MLQQQIAISENFKTKTKHSILSIVLFVLVYFIICALAVGLTIACVYMGISLIITVPRLITIILGIGIASTGFLVLIFLLKFMFKRHKVDRSHLIEIKQSDEPKLFQMIDDIVKEVGTDFPKKVYLSANVNAGVFYDSSFWSMFFPIRKNLQIGIGLVNTISEAELKAILAHEFGHFSQRSMKVGSYVYNVNQVIFNMLFDNEGYDRIIQGWANVSGYFYFFVVIAIKIVEAIQWILRKMYELININYMSLSREMEFHADEIAAHVTGFQPLKDALLRMDLADQAYNSVLNYYEPKIKESIKSQNIYKEQGFVMNFLAQKNGLEIKENIPQVSVEELNKFNKSKLEIKDQWASHPSTEDRIEALEKTGIPRTDDSDRMANTLFKNIEATQLQLTEKLFAPVNFEAKVQLNQFDVFKKDFQTDFQKNSFDKIYEGYYDQKNPEVFDIENTPGNNAIKSFEALFSTEKLDLVFSTTALESDIATLEQIATLTTTVKTFDYDGRKYKAKESQSLIVQLQAELTYLKSRIKENDIDIYHYFKSLAVAKGKEQELITLYRNFFACDTTFEEEIKIYNELSESLEFTGHTTPFDQIARNFDNIKPKEAILKSRINKLFNDPIYEEELTPEIRQVFEKYTSSDLIYFRNDRYYESALETLHETLQYYALLMSRGYFIRKQQLLNFQAALHD